jgi:capsular exopolysaccharide synthesis family protein
LKEAPIEKLIQTTAVENLSLLTCGPIIENPSELLGSARMMELIINLKPQYDLMILDLPPVLAVTDTLVLASQVDGIAMVIRAGVSRPAMVIRAKELLLHADGKLLGVILNGVEFTRGYSNYYYSYSM